MGNYQSEDMKMPPKNLVHPGRLNSEGIGVLYLSSGRRITINEIRPEVGDEVATAELTVKRDLNIADLRKLDNIPVFESGVDSEFLVKYQINRDILNSISTQMKKPSGSQCNNLDYLPTQYISDFIKLKYDGIKYGSTLTSKRNRAYNLALFSDEDVEVNNISYKRITSTNYKAIKIR
ncbi:RES family NAD+ phosphorylase [Gilliamella apicola]|uniref:RES family NAD+ phosphorylase n=1 Tax=Gilliamella apicola TaxID=1196095 RepID=UPI002FEE5138